MYCTKCGAKNSDEHVYCSNCGSELTKSDSSSDISNTVPAEHNAELSFSQQWNQQPYTGPQQYVSQFPVSRQNKFNGMSVAGFILSLCAWVLTGLGMSALICAVLGLIFSIIGIASKNEMKSKGKGLAISGIAISGAYFLFIFFAVLLYSAVNVYY